MQKLVFTTNGYEHPHIGYTTGRRWNGWATPNFEVDEAFAIMAEFNNDAEKPMYYDEETDTFRVDATEYTDADEWRGRNCQTVDGLKHLYGIGAYSWVWEDITEQDIHSMSMEIAEFLWEHDAYEFRNCYADQDEIVHNIAKQLQNHKTLKDMLTTIYVEELSGEPLFERLGGILNV